LNVSLESYSMVDIRLTSINPMYASNITYSRYETYPCKHRYTVIVYFKTYEEKMKKSQNVTVLGDKDNHRGNVQGWVQTDKTAHQAMYKLNLQMPAALTVLHFMISRMARGTSGVVMSHQAIANQIGIHKQTVAKAISLLDKFSFIARSSKAKYSLSPAKRKAIICPIFNSVGIAFPVII